MMKFEKDIVDSLDSETKKRINKNVPPLYACHFVSIGLL